MSSSLESFCWRIEQQIGEGGFALALGDPGTGKSAALRILCERLNHGRDLCVGILTRPQASLADSYRELGELFSVPLSPHNRWNSAKVLREKWLAHIESSIYRPVLIVDEAQEMNGAVFSELRLLSSAELDSRSIRTIVLSGDHRLVTRLEGADLLPIAWSVAFLREDALGDAAVGVIVSVFGAHRRVFDGDQAIFKVPGAMQAVEVGHVAVGVVRKVSSFEFRVSS